jgi:hypothetical protein
MTRAVDGQEPPHTGTPVILSAYDVRVVRGAATLVAVDRFELPERTTHVLLGPNGGPLSSAAGSRQHQPS